MLEDENTLIKNFGPGKKDLKIRHCNCYNINKPNVRLHNFRIIKILKDEAIKKKISLSWTDYKKLIRKYAERLFENYKPPHEYEEEHGWQMSVYVDGWSENNYVVKYFCKSLTGYMRNYVKSKQPKQVKIKMCNNCQSDMEVSHKNKKYCGDCLKNLTKIRREKNNKKYYDKIKTAK